MPEIVKEQASIDEYPLVTTEGVSLRSAVDITAFHNLIEVVDVVLERKNETFTKELFLQNFVRSTTKPLGLSIDTSFCYDLCLSVHQSVMICCECGPLNKTDLS